MSYHDDQLLAEMQRASDLLQRGDRRVDALERELNQLMLRVGRPGFSGEVDDGAFETKSARQMCIDRRALMVTRDEGIEPDYEPTSSEITTAKEARKGFKQLFRAADPGKLDLGISESLSAFSFGNVGWIAPPEVSSRVLSCFTDASDLAALVGQTQISAGSLVLPVDNARPELGAFACDTACWGTGQQPDLAAGIGTMQIKVDPIRATTCTTTDILAGAQIPIETWLQRKAALGFSNLINQAVLCGDGISKPQGILHPRGGIPIFEPSAATPTGTITWQDVLSLKFQVPEPWLSRGSYIMSPASRGQAVCSKTKERYFGPSLAAVLSSPALLACCADIGVFSGLGLAYLDFTPPGEEAGPGTILPFPGCTRSLFCTPA